MSRDETAKAIRDAIQGKAAKTVLNVGDSRVTFTRARALGEEIEPMDEPPDYPSTPTRLKDDESSWLD